MKALPLLLDVKVVLTRSEIEKLNKMGVLSCSLGKRILRSETAPLYMLSAISYALELE